MGDKTTFSDVLREEVSMHSCLDKIVGRQTSSRSPEKTKETGLNFEGENVPYQAADQRWLRPRESYCLAEGDFLRQQEAREPR